MRTATLLLLAATLAACAGAPTPAAPTARASSDAPAGPGTSADVPDADETRDEDSTTRPAPDPSDATEDAAGQLRDAAEDAARSARVRGTTADAARRVGQAARDAHDHADAQARTPSPDDPCTFSMYHWSTVERRAVQRRTVRQTRADLAPDEHDPDDPRCTVCEEDQATIVPAELGIPGVAPFQVCVHWQDALEDALRTIADDGSFEIRELVGYRPGRTRGRIENGLRMELSNHSYGTAIDINASWNGLYRRCNVEVSPDTIGRCQLGVGGAWDPVRNPRLTITRDGLVHRVFTEHVGWRWGGDIAGATKDMMHFSITGY
ncbi:MAG: hypothetical protein EA398_11870 [Deltaproteobacteria bacterium]|nr:MAG: hypothetical protein EA398_11870 [Deltaproteobacteria bacterium]